MKRVADATMIAGCEPARTSKLRADTSTIHWRGVRSTLPKFELPEGVGKIAAELCLRMGEISARTLGKELRTRGIKEAKYPCLVRQ